MNPDTNELRDESRSKSSRWTLRMIAIGLGLGGVAGTYALARATGVHPGDLDHGFKCLMISMILLVFAFSFLESCVIKCGSDNDCKARCWYRYLFELTMILIIEWLCLIR